MNRTSLLTATVAGALLASAGPALSTAVAAPPPAPSHVPASKEVLERGRYLTTIMGCNGCHTPWKLGSRGPEPDMTRMLSGHPESERVTAPPKMEKGPWIAAALHTNTAWAGPWGVSFTANLTPDPETGLGKWTAETFIAALRTGRHEGQGRPILPPMPYPMYRQATDEDLRAVFAYLQSIPAIKNRVPQPIEPAEAP